MTEWYRINTDACASAYRGIASRDKVGPMHSWILVEIRKDFYDEYYYVYFQTVCYCTAIQRGVHTGYDWAYVPKDVNSVVVHCNRCGNPSFRVRGFVTDEWTLELPT